MKDVEYERIYNAVAKHVIETGHTINRHNTKCIEKQNRTIPRPSAQNGVGERAWLRRGNIQRESKPTQSVRHPFQPERGRRYVPELLLLTN
jgi:hypothetical protein